MTTVLIPVPARDSDPTEVAVSRQVLVDAGIDVVFASPDGRQATCDELMVTGEGLDPWGWVPGLRRLPVVGRVLRADAAARRAHDALLADPAWQAPVRWDAIDLDAVDGLLLPGGHRARGMRAYLESPVLQGLVVEASPATCRSRPSATACCWSRGASIPRRAGPSSTDGVRRRSPGASSAPPGG